MADPHWSGYIGMGTGIIGALTGIAGAILGYKGYRRSSELKALDLRLELKRSAVNVISDYKKLYTLMQDADKSRKETLAFGGSPSSSYMDQWSRDFNKDTKVVRQLSSRLPKDETVFDKINATELESELIKVHSLEVEINTITEKYKKAMAQDVITKREIREAINSR